MPERLLVVAALVTAVAAVWYALRARDTGDALPDSVTPADFGLEGMRGRAVLLLTSPYCIACSHWLQALTARGVSFLRFDVRARPELASRYRVRETPLVLVAEIASGAVVEAFTGEPRPEDVDRVAALLAGDGEEVRA